VIWRPATRTPVDEVPVPRRALKVTAWFCVVTAAVCLIAATAELWRWTLMLRGRTEVLPAGTVHASDVLVRSAGLAAGLVGAISVLLALSVVVRTHAAADDRAGLAPARRPAAVLARLVVPVWNLYGAGQIFAEIDDRLARSIRDDAIEDGSSTRVGGWVLAWWVAWIANGVAVLAALGRAFGGSLQAIADTVELHLAVDALAAAVAALAAVIFRRWARAFDTQPVPYEGWVVAPPSPTRGRVQPEPQLRGGPADPADLVSPRR
jgi:hypothetical protein